MRLGEIVKLLLVCLGLLVSCSGKNQRVVEKYFNIPEFLDQQLAILYLEQPEATKDIIFGDHAETIVQSDMDSIQWQKELKIFREHDINKPVLIDAYQIHQEVTDQGKRISYSLIDTTGLGILNLTVLYHPDSSVSSLSSTFREQNLLYGNFREVNLLTSAPGKLDRYSVRGYHKLMFNDTVYYQLEVKLNYK